MCKELRVSMCWVPLYDQFVTGRGGGVLKCRIHVTEADYIPPRAVRFLNKSARLAHHTPQAALMNLKTCSRMRKSLKSTDLIVREHGVEIPQRSLYESKRLLVVLRWLCVHVCGSVCGRERQTGCVGVCVCVSTCYIIESGGRVCFLACHTTAALQ